MCPCGPCRTARSTFTSSWPASWTGARWGCLHALAGWLQRLYISGHLIQHPAGRGACNAIACESPAACEGSSLPFPAHALELHQSSDWLDMVDAAYESQTSTLCTVFCPCCVQLQQSSDWLDMVDAAYESLDRDGCGRIGPRDLEELLCGDGGCEVRLLE